MLRMLCVILLFAVLTPDANADVYNFPAKSVNIGSALRADFFATNTMSQLDPAADAHAVIGIQLADGGYVLGGKGVEAEGNTSPEGFATKLTSTGAVVWAWKSGVVGKDAINGVAQLPNGEVLIAGYRNVGNILKRSLTKLNQADGVEIWTTTDFGDNAANSNGAWEMIDVHATHGAVLSGLKAKPNGDEMSFKSYGNTVGGKAVIMTMTIATLSASTAPAFGDIATTKSYDAGDLAYDTAKTAHFVSATQIAVLLQSSDTAGKKTSFGLFNPTDGSDVYTPTKHSDTIGEGTDMQLVGTTHAVITGQKTDKDTGVGYTGRLTKIALSDGARVWTKEYSSCGFGSTAVAGAPADGQCSKGLVYNECWGIAVMADGGFVISCGTGIENCASPMSGQKKTDCDAGKGDRRAGAYLRGASVWDAMTIKTNSAGVLEWQRVDTYKAAAWPALGTAPNMPVYEGASVGGSTAGEWPIAINNGSGVAIVTDQTSGIGLLKLVAASSTPSATPSSTSRTYAATAAKSAILAGVLVALALSFDCERA